MDYFTALALVKQQRAQLGRAVSMISRGEVAYAEGQAQLERGRQPISTEWQFPAMVKLGAGKTTEHAHASGRCATPCMTCSTVITDPDRLIYTPEGYVCDDCGTETCPVCEQPSTSIFVNGDTGEPMMCLSCHGETEDDVPTGTCPVCQDKTCELYLPGRVPVCSGCAPKAGTPFVVYQGTSGVEVEFDEPQCTCPSLAAGHLPDCAWKAAR